jgi:hypothetical protein
VAESRLSLAHTTIMRWVKRFPPQFVKRWDRFAKSAGLSWGVDETHVKVRGQWVYLYRAVDRAGKAVDFRHSARPDVAAAKAFFAKAIRSQGLAPKTITLDGYTASHRAVREMKADRFLPADTTLRSSKCLNNLIEQDHRNISGDAAYLAQLLRLGLLPEGYHRKAFVRASCDKCSGAVLAATRTFEVVRSGNLRGLPMRDPLPGFWCVRVQGQRHRTDPLYGTVSPLALITVI